MLRVRVAACRITIGWPTVLLVYVVDKRRDDRVDCLSIFECQL